MTMLTFFFDMIDMFICVFDSKYKLSALDMSSSVQVHAPVVLVHASAHVLHMYL